MCVSMCVCVRNVCMCSIWERVKVYTQDKREWVRRKKDLDVCVCSKVSEGAYVYVGVWLHERRRSSMCDYAYKKCVCSRS